MYRTYYIRLAANVQSGNHSPAQNRGKIAISRGRWKSRKSKQLGVVIKERFGKNFQGQFLITYLVIVMGVFYFIHLFIN